MSTISRPCAGRRIHHSFACRLFQAVMWPKGGRPAPLVMVTANLIQWTRDALEHIFDVTSLRHSLETMPTHVSVGGVDAGADNALALQRSLIRAIEQLKPTPDVPAASLAWRVYNALEYRYIRGLTQSEAAAELNISLRQLRREQDKGIEAVAYLLARTTLETPPQKAKAPQSAENQAGPREFLRLDDLLHAVLSLLDPLFEQHNVHVRVSLPTPTPIVWTNRMIMRQVLILSLSWAALHAPDRTLEIEVRMQQGLACLSIATPDNQPERASHRLSALDPQLRDRLIEMAGEIGVSIALPDTTPPPLLFDMTLPISERACLLAVDDSPDAIDLIRRYLDSEPFDLIAVTQAEDALLQARTLQPACILLDVMMPGRDGWEILALLKSHPDTIHIPVVVSSVLRNEDLAYALGAAAVLQKPYTAGQLIAVVQSVIQATMGR